MSIRRDIFVEPFKSLSSFLIDKIMLPVLLLLLISQWSNAQVTPAQIDHWIDTWPYANATKLDSIPIWAARMKKASTEIDYPRGLIYAIRIQGYYHDYNGNIKAATEHYFEFLEGARKEGLLDDEISAVSDLVYIYINTGQYELAKQLLLETIPKSDHPDVSPFKRSVLFNNLGIAYTKNRRLDSAILAYDQSLEIKRGLQDSSGMANLKINLASLHIERFEYKEALKLSEENIIYLRQKDNIPDLIFNLINQAGSYNGLKQYTQAEARLLEAYQLAKDVGTNSLIHMAIGELAIYYNDHERYQEAYAYLVESNKIKLDLVNQQTNNKIAELRETFEADQREQQNHLLSLSLDAERSRKRLYFWGLFGLTIFAAGIGWALLKNRKKNKQLNTQNRLIKNQNEKLGKLNIEKNNLISIVSHDLSSPLVAIKIWAQSLTPKPASDLKEAKEMILQTSDKALNTIRKILTIEEEEMRPLEVKEVNTIDIVDTLRMTFEKTAAKKTVQLVFEDDETPSVLLTDREMLLRALENLLSNAIKFSPPDTVVTFRTREKEGAIHFEISDQGIGVATKEQDQLFTKYFRGSAQPTAGETSTGLGLSIVKRIANELGGSIEVKSRVGQGATFIFSLKV